MLELAPALRAAVDFLDHDIRPAETVVGLSTQSTILNPRADTFGVDKRLVVKTLLAIIAHFRFPFSFLSLAGTLYHIRIPIVNAFSHFILKYAFTIGIMVSKRKEGSSGSRFPETAFSFALVKLLAAHRAEVYFHFVETNVFRGVERFFNHLDSELAAFDVNVGGKLIVVVGIGSCRYQCRVFVAEDAHFRFPF